MISIIITNFNKSQFLNKTIKSCLNQTNKNFEVIFFDDKSTDNSLNIATSLLKNSKINYKIILRKNKKQLHNSYNQMSAINYSLKFCKGKYISLLDADDIFVKNKINYLHFLINNKKKKIIYNSYYILKKKKYSENKRHFKIRKYIWPIFPPTSCLTIEKKLLNKIIKKIYFKKYPTCWFDFRLATYVSKHLQKELHYTYKNLSVYRQDPTGNDFKYNSLFSNSYWKRKLEAFFLLKRL